MEAGVDLRLKKNKTRVSSTGMFLKGNAIVFQRSGINRIAVTHYDCNYNKFAREAQPHSTRFHFLPFQIR
jgi:hypothetical protein